MWITVLFLCRFLVHSPNLVKGINALKKVCSVSRIFWRCRVGNILCARVCPWHLSHLCPCGLPRRDSLKWHRARGERRRLAVALHLLSPPAAFVSINRAIITLSLSLSSSSFVLLPSFPHIPLTSPSDILPPTREPFTGSPMSSARVSLLQVYGYQHVCWPMRGGDLATW